MLAEHSVKIFFDEEAHKYTDEYANIYTSTTTVIGNYSNKFDVKSMARNCARAGRKGNPKYKGKTEAMLEAEWAWMTKVACDEGNDKHNFLERTIKQHTGYNLVGSNCYINSRIHTVVDIVKNLLLMEYWIYSSLNLMVLKNVIQIFTICFIYFIIKAFAFMLK